MTAQPTPTARKPFAVAPVRFAAVAGAYFLASLVGTRFVVQPENLSVFWPAAGLLLGYLLITDRRNWPIAAAAVFVGNVAGNLWHGHTLAVSAGFAVVNVVEPLAVAWLALRAGGPLRLDRTPDVFRLFAVPLVVCAVTALAGAVLVTVGLGAPSFWGVWKTWWLADALGAILFAPLVVAWGTPGRRLKPLAAAEFAAALAALAALVWVIFMSELGDRYAPLAITHPVFPLLLWAALRSDMRGTAVAVVVTAVVATWATLHGRGPFGIIPGSAADKVLITQGFAATVCLSSLVLAAAMRERRAAEDELRGQRQLLRTILDSMGEAVLVADANGRVMLANAAFERLHRDASEAADRPPGEWPKAFGVYLPDGETLCPPERLPIFRAARGEACDDERLVVVNAAHPAGVHISVTGRPVVGPGGTAGGVIAIRDITPTVRAEAALRDREQRFTAVFHSQFQFIGLMSPDGTLMEANRTALAAAGVAETDVLGRPFWETVWWRHDADQQERLRAAVRRAATGERDRFEASHPTADGGLMWVDFSLTPFRDATGAVRLLIPEGRDITGRKRAEAALAANDALLRQFVTHAPAAIAMLDRDMRYLRVSDRWLTDYHLDGQDLIGRGHYEVFPDIPERWKEIHRRVLGGAVESCADDPFPRADGGTEWLQWEARPWHAPDGSIGGLLFFTQVITARKRMEQAIRESEERLEMALDASGMGVWEWDVGTGAVYWSERCYQITGAPFDGTLRSFTDAVHPDDRERVWAAVQTALDTRTEYAAEFRIARPDGETRWLSNVGRASYGTDGLPRRMTGLVEDITARKQAEAAVRASEERYRVLFEQSSDAHLIFDESGIIDCNNAAVAMLRCADKRQVLSLHPAALSPELQPDGRRSLEKCVEMDATARRHGYHRFDWLHRRFDGEVFPCEVTLTPVGLYGRTALLVVWHDLTARKQAEAALRLSEEQFRAAFEYAPIGMALVAPDGHWLRVNRSVCDIVGYSEAELLAIDFQTITHPDDLNADLESVRRVLAGAIPSYQMEKRYLHKSGHIVHALLSVSLVRDADAAPLYFIAQIKDITERKAAAERLAESEERYRSLVEDQTEVVCRLRADGTFTFVNGVYCRTFGKTADELLGRRWQPVAHPDDVPLIEARLAAMTPASPVVVVENRVFDAHGRVRWMEFINRGFYDPAGGLTAIQSVGRDVTDRKLIEERLRKSLDEKQVLLKEIHHRVKNNLQIVSTLLDLQSDYTADAGALEMFKESRGRVKSMALIHERLYRSADVARVDFAEYVRQLADDLYRAYRVSDDNVRLELDVDIAPLTIDIAIPCGLLLNELMSNCFKHAFKGGAAGVIRVSLRGDGAENRLVVADDGVGFPAGVDFRNTASFGLQLVNTLVEQLNGAIELTAGRGTAFAVRFAAGK